MKNETPKNYSYTRRLKQIDPLTAFVLGLRQHRDVIKMSQQQLAGLVGTSQAKIALIEAGKGNPTIGLLRRIAGVFHKDLQLGFRRKLRV